MELLSNNFQSNKPSYPEKGKEYGLDSDRHIFFRRLLLTMPLPCKHFFWLPSYIIILLMVNSNMLLVH